MSKNDSYHPEKVFMIWDNVNKVYISRKGENTSSLYKTKGDAQQSINKKRQSYKYQGKKNELCDCEIHEFMLVPLTYNEPVLDLQLGKEDGLEMARKYAEIRVVIPKEPK